MRRLHPRVDETLRAVLAAALHRSGELRFMHRLHAVLLVGVGHGCYDVARWFGDDPRSIQRWVHAYDRNGAEGLHDHPHAGRPARLTPQQLQQLEHDLATAPRACGYQQLCWSGKLLARHIENLYSVPLSLRQCQRLLQRARH